VNMTESQIAEARTRLVAAGMRLLEEGLAARTWGNLSLRVSDSTMLITPSGIPYPAIRETMLALVDIDSGEWTGPLKPSGERGLHRAIYAARPDVMAIVHTHQNAASACAAARRPLPSSEGEIPCAAYALPGTQRLARATCAALSTGSAALIANHGVVVTGATLEDAFARARKIEAAAADFFLRQSLNTLPAPPDSLWNPDDLVRTRLGDGTSVVVSRAPYTLAWASRGRSLPAVLDDLAQIVGLRVPAVPRLPEKRSGKPALFVKDRGLLIQDPDAEALAMVVEKASRAAICAESVGGAVKLNPVEAIIMRIVYKQSYSKRAAKVGDD
jgi:L-fuculose-phosphate aldolase